MNGPDGYESELTIETTDPRQIEVRQTGRGYRIVMRTPRIEAAKPPRRPWHVIKSVLGILMYLLGTYYYVLLLS